MASRKESETIIIFNQADKDEGFFRFYTTIKSHYESLVRRVGEENIIDLQTNSYQGVISSWDLKLPMAVHSRTTFGVRKPLSPGALEAKRANLAKSREG